MELMIDLETLGTKSDCVVVSIGACFFDIQKRALGTTFYMALDVGDQLEIGRKINADTLKWWFSQSDAAKTVFHEKAQASAGVLNTFALWIKSNCPNQKDLKVWGNGSTFDISILENMFDQYRIKCPWGYNGIMDLRTFRRFVANNRKIEKLGTAHNALDDAKSQAIFVMSNANPTNSIEIPPVST
jgi:hypothetical protein